MFPGTWYKGRGRLLKDYTLSHVKQLEGAGGVVRGRLFAYYM